MMESVEQKAEHSITYTITCGVPSAARVYELETSTRRVTLPNKTTVALSPVPYRLLYILVAGSCGHGNRSRLFSLELIAGHVWPESVKNGKKMNSSIYTQISNLKELGIVFIINNQGTYSLDGRVEIKQPEPETAEQVVAPRLDPELTFYSMIVAVLLTVMVTVSITSLVRGVLTLARMTITQAPEFGFVLGLLQGVAGALIWSVPLAIVFLHRWFRSGETYGSWSRALQSRSAAARMLAMSGAAGFAGGLVIDILIMFAQQPVSLQEAGWTEAGRTSPWTIFTVSHLGWAEPILGLVVCSACTATLLVILRLRPWQEWLQEQQPRLDIRQMASMLLSVGKLFGMWPLAFVAGPVLAVAAALFSLLHRLTLGRFLGEGIVIATAGCVFVIGILFAMLFEAQGASAT